MFSRSLHFSTLIPECRVPSADLRVQNALLCKSGGFFRSTPSAATPRELSAKRQYALRLSVYPRNPGPTPLGLGSSLSSDPLLSTTCNLAARFLPFSLPITVAISFPSFTFVKRVRSLFPFFHRFDTLDRRQKRVTTRQTFGDGSANF